MLATCQFTPIFRLYNLLDTCDPALINIFKHTDAERCLNVSQPNELTSVDEFLSHAGLNMRLQSCRSKAIEQAERQ